ncbi:hypothetical protein IT407_01890 [Candidatus Uhrbacteria bacterium]|nr:hypothetical protein [Candidatus Uhrbacteria bacterium]
MIKESANKPEKSSSKPEKKKVRAPSLWASALAAGMAIMAESGIAHAQEAERQDDISSLEALRRAVQDYDSPRTESSESTSRPRTALEAVQRAARDYDAPRGARRDSAREGTDLGRIQAEAEQYDQPAQRVSLAELQTRSQRELAGLRDPLAMREAPRGSRTVYEGSIEIEDELSGTRLEPSVETVVLPAARELRRMEGHRIVLSVVTGRVAREQHGPGVNEREVTQIFRFRVSDLSESTQVELTGRHVTRTEEAETQDQATALAFSHLDLHAGPYRVRRSHVIANEGGRDADLRVESRFQQSAAVNIHITTERLPNGHFRVTVDADEARVVVGE